MAKYFNKRNGLGNCPKCRGVVFKECEIDQDEDSYVKVNIRCPHCDEDVFLSFESSEVFISEDGYE